MFRRLIPIICLCLFAAFVSGCAGESEVTTPETSSTEPKILKLASAGAATTANPHLAALDPDTELAGLLGARLYSYVPLEDGSGAAIVPDLAAGEPKDVSGNGKVWQIQIDPGAKWANGEPITADTFIYTYKMLLDPVLLNTQGATFSSQYVIIENAGEYYTQVSSGIPVAWEDVGISKVDDHTIAITLGDDFSKLDVMRHFSGFAGSPVYEPYYEAGMNSDRTSTLYGSDMDKIMASGAFALKTWIKGSEHELTKNPNYLHADRIKVDGMNYRVVEDTGTQIQMFESGDLDWILLDSDGIEKYSEDPRAVVGSSRYIRQIEICDSNPDKPILANTNFKKALFHGIDRITLAKVAKRIPAPYIVPTTSVAYADGTTFRNLPEVQAYTPKNGGYDPELALEYFEQALEEEGINSVELSLVYSSTTSDHKIIAEFMQETLAQVFGAERFKLNLEGVPSAQRLATIKSSATVADAYELALADWSRTVTDFNPSRIFEVYTSDFGRRNAPYHYDEIDDLYELSRQSEYRKDERKLAEIAAQMEQIYFEKVISVPTIQTLTMNLVSDRIVLPLNDKHTVLGWGLRYSDIAE